MATNAAGYRADSANAGQLPRRTYGHGQVQLSIVGFGGILVMNADQDTANRTVAKAVEAGVNYFDVAPSYGDAEQRLGPALQPYRKNCFLACKTGKHDAAGASAELTQSLQNLRTDYFDLYQLHGLTDLAKDVNPRFAKGGALEVLTQAKRDGRVRHLGFSAHSVEAALMAMDRYDFDSILFPINFASFLAGGFGPTVIERAKAKGMSILALKAMARQKRPANGPRPQHHTKCWYEPLVDVHQSQLALRFTLSQPVTAALPPGEVDLFELAVQTAMGFSPVSEEEIGELKELAKGLDPLFRA